MKGNLFLGLGGNLGDVRESFRLSLERLAGIALISKSIKSQLLIVLRL